MSGAREESRGRAELLEEIERLRLRLDEAEQALTAMRRGDVDVLVAEGPGGERLYTLAGAERVYRAIVESMHEAALTVGENGTILFCNERFGTLLRVPMEQALGRGLSEFAALPQQEPLREFLEEARKRPVGRRFVLRATDGASVPVLLAASPLETESGPSVCVVASDLTDLEASVLSLRILREHEQALQASEARYRALVEVAPDAIIVHQDARFVFVNPAALRLYGAVSPAQLLGGSVFDRIHPDERAAVEERLAIVKRGGTTPMREMRILRLDGEELPVEATSTGTVWQGGFAIQAVLRDATERKRNEARQAADFSALTRMHALSARLLDAGGLPPLLQEVMDTAVAIVSASHGTLQLFEGDSLRIVAHHAHRPPFLEFFAAAENCASACGEAQRRGERVVVPDVEASPLLAGTPSLRVLREAGVRAVQSTPLMSRTGALLGILTTHWDEPYVPDEHDLWRIDLLVRQAADLIEHARSGEALRESEERLRSVLDHSRDLIYRLDTETGRYEYISPSCEEVVGYSVEKMVALDAGTSWGLVHPDDQPVIQAAVARLEECGEADVEYRLRTRNGDYRWLSNHLSVKRDDSGRPRYRDGNIRDVTQQKEAEEQIQRQLEELRRSNEITQRLNRAMVGRELRMVELKKEVNALCARLGESARYGLEFEERIAAAGSRAIEARGETPPS